MADANKKKYNPHFKSKGLQFSIDLYRQNPLNTHFTEMKTERLETGKHYKGRH